jgi:signal transduction histidine kinase
MSGINPTGDNETFPIDRCPDPVMTYTVEDGEPKVGAINEAFESAFGSITPGEPVEGIAERADISIPDASHELHDYLKRDDLISVRVETAIDEYCARVLPPTDEIKGYVFLIDETIIDPDASVVSSGAPRARLEEEPDGSTPGRYGRDHRTEFDIDRVASVLSHDLRNPLDVAKARLRAARETDSDEHFEHVEQAHDRIEHIIEDVLTLSRGPTHIEPDETIDLRMIVESAWDTVETGDATLTIVDELRPVLADGDRLERLFENLFRNAVEHGDDPAVTVGSLEDGGCYVADDGPGISPEKQSIVFEPGYSSRDHGTGLGLSIVRRIAESHGWSVDIKDEDPGVRFEIRGMDSNA